MSQAKGTSAKIIDFSWTKKVEGYSIDWGLIQSYQTLQTEEVRERLIEAAMTFWKPIVTYALQDKRELAKKQALLSIYKIQNHCQLLSDRFKVNSIPPTRPYFSLSLQDVPPLNFEFRYQVQSNSERGELLQFFLNDKILLNRYEKILKPSIAYWGAIAWEEMGLISSSSEKEEIATYCLYQLEHHIKFLEQFFSLDEPSDNQIREIEPEPAFLRNSCFPEVNGTQKNRRVDANLSQHLNEDISEEKTLSEAQNELLEKGPFDDWAQENFN